MFTKEQLNSAVTDAIELMKVTVVRGLKEGMLTSPFYMVVAHTTPTGETKEKPFIHMLPGPVFAQEGLDRDGFMDLVEKMADQTRGYAVVMGAYNFEAKTPSLPRKKQREWVARMPAEITDWPKHLLTEMAMISIERAGKLVLLKAKIIRSPQGDIERLGRWKKNNRPQVVGRSYSVLAANRKGMS